MTKDGMDRREALSALLALSGGLLAACASEGEGLLESTGTAQQLEKSPAELYQLRELCTKFWNMDNVVRIDIEMDKTEWTALKEELPATTNATCAPVYDYTYEAFPWHKAKSVTFTGSGSGAFPTSPFKVPSTKGIGIKKKSWCGSFSTTKPCLKLDFGEFDDAAKKKIEEKLGTSRLTLNNCKQDASFIRQPLGYYLFGLGALPHARCNFCTVYVRTGTATTDVEFMGIYVNVEPIHSRFLDNNFGTVTTTATGYELKRSNGNLYELEAGEDFQSNWYPSITPEACSKLNEKDYPTLTHNQRIMDFGVASAEIGRGVVKGITNAVDIDQFIKFMAMEFMLKHFDGYTQGCNNTYVYNDVDAVVPVDANGGLHFPEAPPDVRFKFIPWGLDYILSPDFNFHVSATSRVGRVVRGNAETLTMLKNQVRSYLESIFTRERLDAGGDIATFIDKMETILKNLPGFPANITEQITIVRDQLKLVRSAAFIFCGLPASSVYVLNAATGECLHTSSVDTIAGISGAYEVVHQAPASSPVDRWYFVASPVASFRINSRQYTDHPYLHCSSASSTAGHNYLYTTATDDSNNARDFTVSYDVNQAVCDKGARPCVGPWAFSGYYTLQSYRTAQYLCFGTDDPTANQRQRVYQTADAAKATKLRWY